MSLYTLHDDINGPTVKHEIPEFHHRILNVLSIDFITIIIHEHVSLVPLYIKFFH